MSNVQTENSHFTEKIDLRLIHLPEKQKITVLDLCSADGKLWNSISRLTDKKITVIRVEKQSDKKGIYLRGNNLKFIPSLDLHDIDIIDLDSFEIPIRQLDEIWRCHDVRGKIFFVTFIQSIYGGLPIRMLEPLGITKKMYNTIPTLFNNKGWQLFKAYLVLKGIDHVKYYQFSKKYYLTFKVKN
ncbi:MAG: hypothetical protein EPO24_08405 [Bacteroidetes bacterium]|nr:MAG: hypothetical protein EPO24_08405 [Bacteroidota bacterium]